MYKYFLIFLIISSCAYPDIDSVPKFNNMNINEEEAMDLCKINNSDNDDILKCIEEINKSTN